MARVLVTGMSGTGKSTALVRLHELGYRVVDTDWPGWAEELPTADGARMEQLWHEERISALLAEKGGKQHLFVSGCALNQVRFYDRFDAIVLLAAPVDVILRRVDGRRSNTYGKAPAERRQIEEDLGAVEPLLRRGATDEIDASLPVDEVVDALVAIADRVASAG